MKVTDRNEDGTRGELAGRAARCRGVALALGCLVAGVAQANVGVVAGAEQTLHGLLAFFADPENVRGLFGAAAGAVASVIAARPFNRARPAPPARRLPKSAPPAARPTDET